MPPKKKGIQFSDDTNTVTVYSGAASPAETTKSGAGPRPHISFEINEADEKKHDAEHVIQNREKHAALDPAETSKPDNFQQAFNIFEVPTVVDSSKLSASDLRAELKARGLSILGSRSHLEKRLEMYVKEFEPKRFEAAVKANEKIVLQKKPKVSAKGAAAPATKKAAAPKPSKKKAATSAPKAKSATKKK
jgi:hypothetical protein